MLEKVIFFCELPPPFGGVTVKNQLLIDEVFSSICELEIVDFCRIKRNPLQTIPISFKMMKSFVRNDTIVYGFGSYKRLYIALKLQRFIGRKKSISKCVNIVMGGTIAEDVKKYSRFDELLKSVKINLVETKGIMEDLKTIGIENTDIFPNPKPSKGAKSPIKNRNILKCVFFSKICEEKGCKYIMNELGSLDVNCVSIDFYGYIDDKIKNAFLRFVENHPNVKYHGVFDSSRKEVYSELNQYDVLLFPTTWIGEGIPGILIEAKMAGIFPVVSNWKFNCEIVQDKKEGIVLDNLNSGTLKTAIMSLTTDKERVDALKAGSYQSRNKYSLENYKNELLQILIDNEKAT